MKPRVVFCFCDMWLIALSAALTFHCYRHIKFKSVWKEVQINKNVSANDPQMEGRLDSRSISQGLKSFSEIQKAVYYNRFLAYLVRKCESLSFYLSDKSQGHWKLGRVKSKSNNSYLPLLYTYCKWLSLVLCCLVVNKTILINGLPWQRLRNFPHLFFTSTEKTSEYIDFIRLKILIGRKKVIMWHSWSLCMC